MALKSLEELVCWTQTHSWGLACLHRKIWQVAASAQEIPGINIYSFPELTSKGCTRTSAIYHP